jgi:hypothetical protein
MYHRQMSFFSRSRRTLLPGDSILPAWSTSSTWTCLSPPMISTGTGFPCLLCVAERIQQPHLIHFRQLRPPDWTHGAGGPHWARDFLVRTRYGPQGGKWQDRGAVTGPLQGSRARNPSVAAGDGSRRWWRKWGEGRTYQGRAWWS